MKRRIALRALLAGSAAIAAPAVAGHVDPICDPDWNDVRGAAEFFYRFALAFAQCQGHPELACQLMQTALHQVTNGACPAELTVQDLALILGGKH